MKSVEQFTEDALYELNLSRQGGQPKELSVARAQVYATLAGAAAQVADTEAAFGKAEEFVKTADSLSALYRNHACPPADYPAEP